MERVIAGLEKKTRVMNELERKTVAYHESGHALVAELLPHADPVAKISIIPRGRGALGYTLQMPTEDRYLLTEEELTDRIAVMLGGRAAEIDGVRHHQHRRQRRHPAGHRAGPPHGHRIRHERQAGLGALRRASSFSTWAMSCRTTPS